MPRVGRGRADTAQAVDRTQHASHIARGDMQSLAGAREQAILRARNTSDLNRASGQALAPPIVSLIRTHRADQAAALVKRAIDTNPTTPG